MNRIEKRLLQSKDAGAPAADIAALEFLARRAGREEDIEGALESAHDALVDASGAKQKQELSEHLATLHRAVFLLEGPAPVAQPATPRTDTVVEEECEKCHARSPAGSKFCASCGASLDDEGGEGDEDDDNDSLDDNDEAALRSLIGATPERQRAEVEKTARAALKARAKTTATVTTAAPISLPAIGAGDAASAIGAIARGGRR